MAMAKRVRNYALAAGMATFISFGAAAQSTQTTGPDGPNPGPGRSAGSVESGAVASSRQLGSSDREFVRKAAEGGLAEVELGQLATQKASSDDVKQFGQRMVSDHTQANDQLKQIAAQKGVTLPTSLSSKDAMLKSKLEKLSGAEFDRMYMQHMVKDHTKDVNEFQEEANKGKDSDVKGFASQTAPKLQEHLSLAQQVAAKTGASASSGNSGSMGSGGSMSTTSTSTDANSGR